MVIAARGHRRVGPGLLPVLLVGACLWPASASAAQGASRPTRACVVKITRFRVHPRAVVEGRKATLKLVLANCTGTAQSVSITRYGRLGCLVVDPLRTEARLPAHAHKHFPQRLTAPHCTGQMSFTATVENTDGQRLAQATAHGRIVAAKR